MWTKNIHSHPWCENTVLHHGIDLEPLKIKSWKILFYYWKEQIELWLRRVWGVACGCTVDNVRTRRLHLIILGFRRLRLIVLGLRRLCLIISTLFGKVTKIVRDRMKSFLTIHIFHHLYNDKILNVEVTFIFINKFSCIIALEELYLICRFF